MLTCFRVYTRWLINRYKSIRRSTKLISNLHKIVTFCSQLNANDTPDIAYAIDKAVCGFMHLQLYITFMTKEYQPNGEHLSCHFQHLKLHSWLNKKSLKIKKHPRKYCLYFYLMIILNGFIGVIDSDETWKWRQLIDTNYLAWQFRYHVLTDGRRYNLSLIHPQTIHHWMENFDDHVISSLSEGKHRWGEVFKVYYVFYTQT